MSNSSMESFLEACGAAGPLGLLVEASEGQEPQRHLFPQPFALIGSGRHLQNDVILADSQVSRRHAYLQVIAGQVFCIDLHSRTGTHWPEGPRAAGWLLPTQTIRLGGHNLSLPEGEPSLPNLPREFDPMAAGSLQAPWLTLEFLNGRTKKAQWSMNRMLALIGTADQCKVRLHDPAVAPIHGSLVCTARAAWLVDLLGPGGIYLNGQRIRCARLQDGDQLVIGDFVMRLRFQPTAALAPDLAPAPRLLTESNGRGSSGSLEIPARVGTLAQSQTLLPGDDRPGKAVLESILLPLVQQFSLIQNQMFDQFREAMVMMFQMFGNLQKDQMELIRQELGRVQDLTQEIQTLQAELKKQSARSGASLPETWAENPRGDRELKYPTAVGNPQPDTPEFAAQIPAQSPVTTSAVASGQPAPKSGTDVHAWLCRRMAELQEDRRSRLQKILSFLSGK